MTAHPLPLPGWAIKALDEERLTQWRDRCAVAVWRAERGNVDEDTRS